MIRPVEETSHDAPCVRRRYWGCQFVEQPLARGSSIQFHRDCPECCISLAANLLAGPVGYVVESVSLSWVGAEDALTLMATLPDERCASVGRSALAHLRAAS